MRPSTFTVLTWSCLTAAMICSGTLSAERTEEWSCLPAEDSELEELKQLTFPGAGLGVNVSPMKQGAPVDGRARFPSHNMNPVSAVEIKNPNVKSLNGSLSFVGEGACHFGIFHKAEPKSFLEPGDIMLPFDPKVTKWSGHLYRSSVNGMTHAALVVAKPDGKLMHIDSPWESSGDEFKKEKSFHILRLRQVPKEIDSKQELSRWLNDPVKRRDLKVFLGERKCKIAIASELARLMYERGYDYVIGPSQFKRNPDKFREALYNKQLPKPELHCSALVETAYGMVGVNGPQARSIAETVGFVDHYLDQAAKRERKTREQAATTAVSEIKNELDGNTGLKALLVRMLVRHFPSEVDKNRLVSVTNVLKQRPDEMKRMIEAGADERISRFITADTTGPADLFRTIYDENSEFSYGGTYLPETRPRLHHYVNPSREVNCP